MKTTTPKTKRYINHRRKFRNSEGFTLIELMVVISIVSFLASLLLVTVSSARERARNVKRVTDAKQLATAVELYRSTNGTYPITVGAVTNIPGLAPTFVGAIPAAPLPIDSPCSTIVVDQNSFLYESDPTGNSYGIQFCISKAVGTLRAGVYEITELGILYRYDLNNDGVVDVNDASWLLANPALCHFARCDLTGNGSVSSTDASRLSQILPYYTF